MSSSAVATATSVTALGELDAVGEKFAKSRSAKLVSAKSREVDGALVYTFELQGDLYHELLSLTINRGKLFRLNTVTSNKKWAKREELYKNIHLSFVPNQGLLGGLQTLALACRMNTCSPREPPPEAFEVMPRGLSSVLHRRPPCHRLCGVLCAGRCA